MGNQKETQIRGPTEGALHVMTNEETLAAPGEYVGRLVLDAMRRHAEHLAIPAQVDFGSGRSISYPELLDMSTKAALGWRALGLARGQTLAVMSTNCHFMYPAFFGALFEAITIVFIPLDPDRATNNVLQHYLSISRPTAFLTDEVNLGLVIESVGSAVPVVVPSDKLQSTSMGPNVYTVLDLMAKGKGGFRGGEASYVPPEVPDPYLHVTFCQFSSGTTGLPKIVEVTSNYLAQMRALMVGRFVRQGDRVLVSPPTVWGVTINSTLAGATRVYGTRSDAAALLDAMADFKVTTGIFGKGRIQDMAREAERRRSSSLSPSTPPPCLGSVRALLAVGAALRADAHRRCLEALRVPVLQVYGMTECGILTLDAAPPRPGSVGRIVPQTRIRLVDLDSGRDVVQPYAEGELRVQCPALLSFRYHGNPEATRQCFDEHGFFRTGDLAYCDEDGYFFVKGRIKEMFKYNCHQISPSELEDVLESHPAVQEACVVGRPDDTYGRIPAAFVVRAEGSEVTARELRDLIRDRAVNVNGLQGGVYFVDEIPKSINYKVLRRKFVESLPPLEADNAVDG